MIELAMACLQSPSARAGAALQNGGCSVHGRGGYRFGPQGKLALHALKPEGGWQRFLSAPIAIPGVAPGASIAAAPAPAGPFKLLAGARPGTVRLAADLPLSLLEAEAHELLDLAPGYGEAGGDSLKIWSEDLLDAVKRLAGFEGETLPLRSPTPRAGDIVPWLGSRGWVCAETAGELHVNFQGEQLFKQVLLRPDGDRGHRLEVELAQTRGWSEVSLAAAAAVCLDANESLKLARITGRLEPAAAIVLEVHLGRLPLPSAWLHLSLDALRAGVSLLAREIPALADPVLAEWIVASTHLHGTAAGAPRARSSRSRQAAGGPAKGGVS